MSSIHRLWENCPQFNNHWLQFNGSIFSGQFDAVMNGVNIFFKLLYSCFSFRKVINENHMQNEIIDFCFFVFYLFIYVTSWQQHPVAKKTMPDMHRQNNAVIIII